MTQTWKENLEKRVNQRFDEAIQRKGFLSLKSIIESQFKYHGKKNDLVKLEKRKNKLAMNIKRRKVVMLPHHINIVRYSTIRKKISSQEKINNVIKIWHAQRG